MNSDINSESAYIMQIRALKLILIMVGAVYLIHILNGMPFAAWYIEYLLSPVLLMVIVTMGYMHTGYLGIMKPLPAVGGAVIAGLLCFAVNFYCTELLSGIYNTQPEWNVWLMKILYDLVNTLLPGLLFLLIIKISVREAKPINPKAVGLCCIIAAVAVVLLSVLCEVFVTRIVPSELVGDFGAEVGGGVHWLFDELLYLALPAFLLLMAIVNYPDITVVKANLS